LPNLAEDITADARYLAEVSRADFELFGNPIYVANMLNGCASTRPSRLCSSTLRGSCSTLPMRLMPRNSAGD